MGGQLSLWLCEYTLQGLYFQSFFVLFSRRKSYAPFPSTVEILLSRQKKAELLKKMTDVAVRMSEEQLVELRADIKHFVSERKYDEDLGRVAQFTCDVETLKKNID